MPETVRLSAESVIGKYKCSCGNMPGMMSFSSGEAAHDLKNTILTRGADLFTGDRRERLHKQGFIGRPVKM